MTIYRCIPGPDAAAVVVDDNGTLTSLAPRMLSATAGFDWGRLGAGSADLACSILWRHLETSPHPACYGDFARQVVALWAGGEAFEITSASIDEWLSTWIKAHPDGFVTAAAAEKAFNERVGHAQAHQAIADHGATATIHSLPVPPRSPNLYVVPQRTVTAIQWIDPLSPPGELAAAKPVFRTDGDTGLPVALLAVPLWVDDSGWFEVRIGDYLMPADPGAPIPVRKADFEALIAASGPPQHLTAAPLLHVLAPHQIDSAPTSDQPTHPAGPLIVALGHRARSGKDLFAQILVDNHGFTRIAFADDLKAYALSLVPYLSPDLAESIVSKGIEAAKNEHPEVRDFLIGLGQGAKNHFGQDFWVNRALANLNPNKRYVVTDTRFPVEVEGLIARGAHLVRVDRPCAPIRYDAADVALADFDGWHHVIVNDASPVELAHKATVLLGAIASHPAPIPAFAGAPLTLLGSPPNPHAHTALGAPHAPPAPQGAVPSHPPIAI